MKEVSGINFDYYTLKPADQITDKDFSELERRCDETQVLPINLVKNRRKAL